MILQAIFFYLFAAACVASAVMVIASKNPVHSVLFLILAFVNAAGLFVLMGAEFLAMILDVDFSELRDGFLNYLPIGGVIGAILLAELLVVVGAWAINPGIPKTIAAPIAPDVSNTQALGLVLYTRYVYYFEAAGVILLVAMVGTIVLTLQHKPNVRRQNIAAQVARGRSSAIEIVKVKSGQGLS